VLIDKQIGLSHVEDLTGKYLEPYRIGKLIGRGGMAHVYEAYDTELELTVAVKVLLPGRSGYNSEFLDRFRQEAQTLEKLRHPNILPFYKYVELHSTIFIVMEFIKTGTLRDILNKQPLPLLQIRRIISQIGSALHYAHNKGEGIVHRDVKPANILIDEYNNHLLADFGISKLALMEEGKGERHITKYGDLIGTPTYMSPEQAQGKNVDHRSDIYSLGIVLYQLATGRVPFDGSQFSAIIYHHINTPLPPPKKLNPSLSDTVQQIILKSLEKSPDDRYSTAREMVLALQAAIPEGKTFHPESESETKQVHRATPYSEGLEIESINPFVYDQPVLPDQFVGRENYLVTCWQYLAGRRNTSIIVSGENGMGTTSFLHKLIHTAKLEKWEQAQTKTKLMFVNLDCQYFDQFGLDGFWRNVVEGVRQEAPSHTLTEWIDRLLGAETIGFDVVQQLLSQLSQEKMHLVLSLDHFADLINARILNRIEVLTQFFFQLKTLTAQPETPFSLIIVSHKILNTLCENIIKGQSALLFYKAYGVISLAPFTSDEVARLLEQILSESDYKFEELDINFLQGLSHGHPARLQMAAFHLFEAHRQKRISGKSINYDQVEEKFRKSELRYFSTGE
jgi:tRNA A-37 threonylcarbamoyl transferase component Bud32